MSVNEGPHLDNEIQCSADGCQNWTDEQAMQECHVCSLRLVEVPTYCGECLHRCDGCGQMACDEHTDAHYRQCTRCTDGPSDADATGSAGESPSYRSAMTDAGRGHLLR